MRGRLYVSAVLLAVAAPAAMASTLAPSLAIQSGSRVWVEGTSTVRSWRCESARVEGSAATQGPATTVIAELQGSVQRAEATIPVAALDCRNGTMNEHMRRALKAEANPGIRFRMASQQVSGSDAQGTVKMQGTLTIAGSDQPVTVDGTLARDASGTLRVRGTKQLKMSDFGVQPPRLMMGTLKVNDAVTVGFDVVLRP